MKNIGSKLNFIFIFIVVLILLFGNDSYFIEQDKEISVPSGKFICDRITPIPIIGESFKNDGQISIWFSKETRNKIPIKIRLKLKFGSLVMELVDKV